MNIVDYLTGLGGKFALVDASTIKGLQIQLNDEYVETLDRYKNKIKMNDQIKFEMETLDKELNTAVEAGNEEVGRDIAYRMKQLTGKIENPTLVEKACNFFNKPYVRLALLLSFGIVSALLARFILKKSRATDEEEREETNDYQGGQYQNYPPMYGYPTPPPYPYQPYGRGSQQQRFN